MAESQQGRDLILAHNQFAFVQDESKGGVIVFVGPATQSLSTQQRPVTYNPKSRTFEQKTLEAAIQQFPAATEGYYIVLDNPSVNGKHPNQGSNNLDALSEGRKVNIPGPATFPLWPGQVANVLEGHHLRSNQYLLVRVYNEEAARDNWSKSVVKLVNPKDSQTDGEGQSDDSNPQGADAAATDVVKSVSEVPVLTMGKQLVIKGTDVSFYIPPTGVEVLADNQNSYVRDAVTLERLEYCILLDEGGNKRFEIGPKVVFPSATEIFVEKERSRKFRAIELNDDMGLHIKVIADYTEGTKEHKVGEELFITGKEQKIYYPREEHAIIKYGDREVVYGVAIPAGEARYVLNKITGEVKLEKGPQIFLPDPRKEVIVRRLLDEKTVKLWYPGNEEALRHNIRLRPSVDDDEYDYASRLDRTTRRSVMATEMESLSSAGESIQRGSRFTPPRSITLDTKYEGAVAVNVWTGYAIQVVSKTGERKVVTGPKTVLLEYDEALEILELSTGTPKTDDRLIKTVYLRVANNKVSDVVEAETSDMVGVKVSVSYRVNFVGDSKKWFDVENYVRFLVDHTRSIIRNAIKKYGIGEFNDKAIDIVRDAVLGASEEGKRKGRMFEENGMQIYDVEVLTVRIGDEEIANMLVDTQHQAVRETIRLAEEGRKLETTRQTSVMEREGLEIRSETARLRLTLEGDELKEKLVLALAKVAAEIEERNKRTAANIAQQKDLDTIADAELARDRKEADQELALQQERQKQQLELITAEVEAYVKRVGAISPDFIAALQQFGDQELAAKLAEAVAPLAVAESEGLDDAIRRVFKGTVFENMLTQGLRRPNRGERSDRP